MRISEIFGPVTQGEGLHVGVPSIFLRLFGCNLRCRGFNVPNYQLGNKNVEAENIIQNLILYPTIEDLPQVKTGCDTFYAIYPEMKKYSQDMTSMEVYEEIYKRCYNHSNGFKKKEPELVITGGEPLLHQKHLLDMFMVTPLLNTIKTVTFETNGTQKLSTPFSQYIDLTSHNTHWIFSISPKLRNSGHPQSDTLVPEAVSSYALDNVTVFLKFVISFDEHIDKTKAECMEFIKEYRNYGVIFDEVCIMPEGTSNDDHYFYNAKECANWCCQMGFRYSPRLQVELFGNGVGT